MVTITIVGRANVGKSTLFNRLLGERKAITADLPGTTRDRLYGRLFWNNQSFMLIDTAGLEPGLDKHLDLGSQIEIAISEADLLVFLTDAKSGLTEKDIQAFRRIQKAKKPYILAANKYDSDKYAANLSDFYRLTRDDLMPISALNGRGTGDLLDAIAQKVKKITPKRGSGSKETGVKTAIIGRPNVGKSSLLNQLLGENRVVIGKIPGTTRDSTDAKIETERGIITFVDTAGIRRRGKIGKVDDGRVSGQIEKYSVIRSLRTIEEAEIILLVIDASEGVTAQDLHIAGFAAENLKSLILVINKWDLNEEDVGAYLKYLQQKISFLSYVPVVFVSTKTGKNVTKIIDLIFESIKMRQKRIPTHEINSLLGQDILKKSPPAKKGKLPKINYATQAETSPPRFIFFVNYPDLIHFSYRRYLENKIREHWDFFGTPIDIIFKKKNE